MLNLAMTYVSILRYNDTPDGDWVISRHPSMDGLVLATAGSGHAYKVRHEITTYNFKFLAYFPIM